jgi:hypothetical protein
LNDFLTLNSCQFLQAIGVTSAREGYIDTKKTAAANVQGERFLSPRFLDVISHLHAGARGLPSGSDSTRMHAGYGKED